MSWDARAISPFIKPLCDEYSRTGGGYQIDLRRKG